MINFKKASEICGGNKELFVQMMELFVSISPGQLKRVRRAYENGDYDELTAAAHDLKSSSSSFGGEILYDSAFKVEQSSKKNLDLDLISFMIKEVEQNIYDTIRKYNENNWQLYFEGDL